MKALLYHPCILFLTYFFSIATSISYYSYRSSRQRFIVTHGKPIHMTQSTFETDITTSQMPPTTTPLPFLAERRPLKTALLALAARTKRGELASSKEIEKALDIVSKLESFNPTSEPALSELINGKWELIFSNTQLFRSSPFFMAARALCEEGEQSDRFNTFCDLHQQSLAFTNIGRVSQTISPFELISEFETNVPFPGLPLSITGIIMSSSDISEKNSDSLRLHMDTVRIKEGSSNIPLLKTFLDTFTGIPTRALESILGQTPFNSLGLQPRQPVFRVTYVDTHMRIGRDQDNHVFIYNRV